jgi:hypothetical protein
VGAPVPGRSTGITAALATGASSPFARRAPGPGRQRRHEPVQYVPELVIRAGAAHVGAQPQRPAAQQAAVLGQQYPAAGVRLLDEGIIAGVIGPGRVYAGQP